MLTLKTSVAVAGVLLVGVAAGTAQAQCFTSYSGYYYSAPVYVAPAPVVVAPAPVVAVPAPVYYSPRVYYPTPVYRPAPVYRSYGYVHYSRPCHTRVWYGGYHGHHRSRAVSFGFGWRH